MFHVRIKAFPTPALPGIPFDTLLQRPDDRCQTVHALPDSPTEAEAVELVKRYYPAGSVLSVFKRWSDERPLRERQPGLFRNTFARS